MTTPVLHADSLSRSFAGTPPVHALRDATFQVHRGDYVAITGPSGSGKSTLLNLIGLLDRPTGGDYFLNGVCTTSLSDKHRTRLRAQHIGFVFQSFHLMDFRTTVDNVQTSMLYARTSAKDRQRRAIAALTRVGLQHRLDATPNTLSGGERQRVAIARALAQEPTLLLCDEPTGSLDSTNTAEVLALFRELHQQGVTIVLITHEHDVAAAAATVVSVSDGVVTA